LQKLDISSLTPLTVTLGVFILACTGSQLKEGKVKKKDTHIEIDEVLSDTRTLQYFNKDHQW
jgi:hypothetical protein